MRASLKTAAIGGLGLAFVAGGIVYMVLMSPPPRSDTGGGVAPIRLNPVPRLAGDPMQPVDDAEADRRATQNARAAETAAREGKSFVAGPLITSTQTGEPPRAAPAKPPLPEVVQPDPDRIAAANLAAAAQVQPDAGQRATEAERKQDEAFAKLVHDQLDKLMETRGGAQWATVAFKAPPPPPRPEPRPRAAAGGGAAGTPPQGPPIVDVLAAKSGDLFYSRMTVGFNSDDPGGLPVFATIHDARPDGTYGPLHGARVMGSVVYSQTNAAVPMQRLILPDGREAPTKAMAVTLAEVRAGVAERVEHHTLSRWSGLLAASLIQGAGLVGQQLIANNRSYIVTGGGAVVSTGNPEVDWGQAGLAALAPLGQNLSSVVGQGFNRPPTKSARGGPDGYEVGIVFLESVTIPTLLQAVPGAAAALPGRGG